jgi:hypothetical protein
LLSNRAKGILSQKRENGNSQGLSNAFFSGTISPLKCYREAKEEEVNQGDLKDIIFSVKKNSHKEN